MSEHIMGWIAAFHDGELTGALRQKVEAHIVTCTDCRADLEALKKLSGLLQEAPPLSTALSPERFVSQVRLRMGAQPVRPAWQRRLRTGWWLAPAGVIGMWAFGQAVLLVSGWLMTLMPVLQLSPGMSSLMKATLSWPLGQGLVMILTFDLLLSLLTAILLGGWLASWWAAQKDRLLRPKRARNDSSN